ncbi:PH domain-containing protein [Capnocytophaga sp. ARDL2]|uniref:PH domain-containing protein n=1 Tax=Capnocytophaga sp. ARDL2 TaxID=3238809 RepID=UPI0035584765
MDTIKNYQAEIHWMSKVKPCFFIAIGLPSLILLPYGIKYESWFSVAFLSIFIYLFIVGIYKLLLVNSIKIEIGQQFLTVKEGILVKRTADLLLFKMEGIGMYESVLGRMLGYGILTISTGEIAQSFMIANPKEFREKLLENKYR